MVISVAEILHEAEELWQRQSAAGSDSGSEVGSVSSGTSGSDLAINEHYLQASRLVAAAHANANTVVAVTPTTGVVASTVHGSRIGPTIITVNGVSSAAGSGVHHLDSMLYTSMDEPQSSNPNNMALANHLDLSTNSSTTSSCNPHHHHQFLNLYKSNSTAGSGSIRASRSGSISAGNSGRIHVDDFADNDMVIYDEAVDLEPIDFEHFVDEPDLTLRGSPTSGDHKMFKVSFDSGETPLSTAAPKSRKLM